MVTRCRHISALILLLLAAPAFADKLDDDLAAAKASLLAGDADAATDKLDALKVAARQALTAKADDAHANYILGMAYMYSGDDAQALRALEFAAQLEPKNATYAFGRADLSTYQGKPGEAALVLQRFLKEDPKNVEAWDLLGVAQLEDKQFDAARESFQKAVTLAPKEPKYLARIAEAFVAQGKDDDAIAAYERVLALDPKYAIGLASLGDIYLRRKNTEKALPLFTAAAESNPNDYRSIARQIQIYQSSGKTAQRDAALERIRKLHDSGKVEFTNFCREQFAQDKNTVVAFEYFPVKGADSATIYSFVVLGPDGKEIQQRLQLLVSGESKNTPSWSLVADTEKTHKIAATFLTRPGYEEARRAVDDYLAGRTPATISPR